MQHVYDKTADSLKKLLHLPSGESPDLYSVEGRTYSVYNTENSRLITFPSTGSVDVLMSVREFDFSSFILI